MATRRSTMDSAVMSSTSERKGEIQGEELLDWIDPSLFGPISPELAIAAGQPVEIHEVVEEDETAGTADVYMQHAASSKEKPFVERLREGDLTTTEKVVTGIGVAVGLGALLGGIWWAISSLRN